MITQTELKSLCPENMELADFVVMMVRILQKNYKHIKLEDFWKMWLTIRQQNPTTYFAKIEEFRLEEEKIQEEQAEREAEKQAKKDNFFKKQIEKLKSHKPTLKKFLEKRNIKPKKRLIPIIIQCFKQIKKEKSKGIATLEPVTSAATITAIVSAVLAFIVDLITKHNKGQDLGGLEGVAKTASGIEAQIRKEIESAVKTDVKGQAGNFLTDNFIYIGIGLVALVLFLKSKK